MKGQLNNPRNNETVTGCVVEEDGFLLKWMILPVLDREVLEMGEPTESRV